MQHAFRSGKLAVIALLATGLLGLPEAALARDRCDRNNSRSSQNSRYNNQNRYSTSNQYRGGGYSNSSQRYDPYYSNNSGYYNDDYRYNEPRSAGKSAAIIGGSAAAGAGIGALSGGMKGAMIGAAVGGVGGLIYDRTTRNNPPNGW